MAHGASNSDGPFDESEESGTSETPTDSELSTPPGTLFAEVFVAHDDLVLVPTIESVPDVTLQMETPLTADCSLVFVSVVGTDFAAFERSVETDATVDEVTLFSATADRRLYRLRSTASSTSFFATITELGARLLGAKSGTDGWVVRIQMLSREPLIELRRRCLEADIEFKVRQLYDGDPDSELEDGRLTGRQRDTVLTAYQSGYYDVPRGISQGELAEKLDVSTSAISQQLRRATGQLIASTFATDRD